MPTATASRHVDVSSILTSEMIDYYQTNGFVRVPGILTPEETTRYREAVLQVAEERKQDGNIRGSSIFDQFVNCWRDNETVKELTLNDKITAVAKKLAGVPLRLWHDHVLIKEPKTSTPTEFHQDQPYWPHSDPNPLSAWVALCDVPARRGCMSFIPKSQKHTELQAQNLSDDKSLFGLCPELEYEDKITVPLRAGDCTFHHGRCAHMANANVTDEKRIAMAIIYMDATTTYDGTGHVVTDPMNLQKGCRLDNEDMFPEI